MMVHIETKPLRVGDKFVCKVPFELIHYEADGSENGLARIDKNTIWELAADLPEIEKYGAERAFILRSGNRHIRIMTDTFMNCFEIV